MAARQTCTIERQDAIKKDDICALHWDRLGFPGAGHKVVLGYEGWPPRLQIPQCRNNLIPCKGLEQTHFSAQPAGKGCSKQMRNCFNSLAKPPVEARNIQTYRGMIKVEGAHVGLFVWGEISVEIVLGYMQESARRLILVDIVKLMLVKLEIPEAACRCISQDISTHRLARTFMSSRSFCMICSPGT